MHPHTLSSDHKVLPSDYHDSNHPHYPHDVEKQSGRRRSLWINKTFLTAALLLMTIVCMTGSVFSGIALAHMGSNNVKVTESATVIAGSPITVHHEVQTVIETATTVIHTSTRVPQLYIPGVATATMTMSPSPVTPEAPLRPILIKKALPTSSMSAVAVEVVDAPTLPMALSDGESDVKSPQGELAKRCIRKGMFATLDHCQHVCNEWNGRQAECVRDFGTTWTCVACFNRPVLVKKALPTPSPAAAGEIADVPTPPMSLSDRESSDVEFSNGELSSVESSSVESSSVESSSVESSLGNAPQGKSANGCFKQGNFNSKSQCESRCQSRPGISAHCYRDYGVQWSCFVCF